MKNTVLLLCLIFSFYSCNKQNKNRELPCEKVYIVECNWTFSEEDYKIIFRVVGFSELDKSFNLRFAYRTGYDYDHYYTSNISLTDSFKNKISDIINDYQTDTTFLYQGNGRIYDDNSYLFIFQKNDNELTRIYFEPQFLPQDLLFLYNYLYENRQKQVGKNQYAELFTIFENIGREMLPPPPILKETIQFTPPVIKKKK